MKGTPIVIYLALGWMVVVVTVALGADLISPYDYLAMDLRTRLAPLAWLGGAWLHPLGTDELGRDVLSRLIQSTRTSIVVAIIGTAVGACLGTGIGLAAARYRGFVDDVVLAAIDFQAALPFLILALAALAFLDGSFVVFVALMGVYGWERYARIVRAMTLSAQTRGYAIALRVLGASPLHLYLRHILPNIASAIIVNVTLTFPEIILLETSLSFLGIGIQPPATSLGNMVGFGRDYLMTAWWIAVAPSVVIFLTTLSLSLLGDWLRDRFDPALRAA